MDLVTLKTKRGFEISLPKDEIPYQQSELEKHGVYEPDTEDCIYKVVQPGMRVAECGACCGYHAMNLAAAVGPSGKVFCFEANPILIDILQKNLATNGFTDNTVIIHNGLWSEEGWMPFPVFKKGHGGAGFRWTNHWWMKNSLLFPIARRIALRTFKRPLRDLVRVDVLTLDSYFGDDHIDFLRMDIEGAELEVLRGASNLLKNRDVGLILECTPENNPEEWSFALYDLVTGHGYRVFRILNEGLTEIKHRSDFHAKHEAECRAGQRDVLCQKNLTV